jgi:error-prone DNA polymerase
VRSGSGRLPTTFSGDTASRPQALDRHGPEGLAMTVPRHCEERSDAAIQQTISARHAGPAVSLRLGLRMVNGFSLEGAARLTAARAQRPFDSVDDLATRGGLDPRDLKCLAAAGALASLAGHRRQAYWNVAGIERATPLAMGRVQEAQPELFPLTEGQDLVADYASLGFSLGRHPLVLLRDHLQRERLLTAAELSRLPHGRLARAAGLVINRQRPGTASGVTFLTLEDETGHINVVVWRDLAERQRRELLGSRLLAVYGKLEKQGEVAHLIAGHLRDLTPLLGELMTRSRDFH